MQARGQRCADATAAMPSTPLPVATVRALGVLCTAGVSVALLFSIPERDASGREHVLSPVQRALYVVRDRLTTVDDNEARAIRARRARERGE